ncbi:corepressor interacting with RBPJ 1 [Thrips palmi]|uniref:Corepressor interacting with RBPJ 1 n=1 Tax=Thrips palmi TaxID=161013 RepID=A0A6P8ZP29_THRPL|nr:corepressor interacting with RBPJ 1 [Thrips palmi]
MGKGFNNYMCKKFFHPASRDNLKRVWMAEQQTESYKKKQEELRVQYEKEQDLYTNKAIMSKESKEKLSVNFLYEPPPGTKKDREREDDEPEFKFEWQRKYNAPRESYCKGDQEIRDQPFGIQVRNVRCIKCHKWGHINTDKECPMYNQAAGGGETGSNLNPSDLIRQMREDGLAMKKGAVGLLELPGGPSHVTNQQLIPSSDEDEEHMNETELKFLEGLSTKKKLKLLRKLEKMEKKKKKKNKKDKKKKESSRKKNGSDSGGSESESDSSPSRKKRKRNVQNSTENHFENKVKIKQEKKDMENELYFVLGRKMDFEGPPQNHSKSATNVHHQNGSSSRKRISRSNSRSRSRSRSPSQDKRKYAPRIKEDPDDPKRHRNVEPRKRSRSPAGSPLNSRNKHDKSSRVRERPSSRDRNRRISRSRSREPRRRSRTPTYRDSSNRHQSSHRYH